MIDFVVVGVKKINKISHEKPALFGGKKNKIIKEAQATRNANLVVH